MAPKAVENLMERLADAAGLDAAAKPVAKKVAALIPSGFVKDLLSGTWLGHPLHPMLTDVPIGCWTNAMLLDLVGGERGQDAADLLVAVGVVSALPTAAAGLADWSDTLGGERRLGFVHAVGNVAAVTCYTLSWRARRQGNRSRGVRLGLLGATLATLGAYVGGHLAWRKGVNVDRHAWEHGSHDWIDVAAEEDVVDGKPVAVSAGDATVLLLQAGTTVYALSDVCAHMGGPLHEGQFDRGCVTCPWHGSVFRLDDGSVVHGPGPGPQPA
ncbi:MAG: Rieske 2Fe-2S domain-containing protein [Actinobacteria bacterium]|nr:Rieske 2Fe-2S domain-containing protein [Actinomycetota bacterium]